MAKSQYAQNNFLSGVLSPLMNGNVTLQQYYQGMQKGENVVIVPQGGVKRRAGLQFVVEPFGTLSNLSGTITMPNGGTPSTLTDDTTTTTTSNITANDTVIAEYDLGTAQAVDLFDVEGDVSTGTQTFRLEYSDDGVSWLSSGAAFSLGATETHKRTRPSNPNVSQHRYWRLIYGFGTVLNFTVTLRQFLLVVSGSAAGQGVKLKSFSPSAEDEFFVIVTPENLRVIQYNNGLTILADFKTPFADGLNKVRAVSNGRVLLLFHEDYPPQRLIYYPQTSTLSGGIEVVLPTNPFDTVSDFNLDAIPFEFVPQFDYNDDLSPTPVAEQQDLVFASFSVGMQFQININNILSKQITFAGDSTPDEQAATEENIRKNLQDMPVFGDTGISVNRVGIFQYRITIEGESADSFNLFSGFNTSGTTSASMTFTKVATGSPRKEDVWSDNRGWPRSGEIFEGRLWIAGTRDKPQSIFASKSGSFLDFDTGSGSDDEAIFSTLSSRKTTDITDIYAGRNLQIYTTGGEYASLAQGLTPSSFNLTNQTSHGSLNLGVVEADGAVVFADRNGKTLREYVYTFNEDSYIASDISVLASHLIKTPLSMAFLTGTASDDANWLFIVNADGTASILNKLRSQDINGFTEMTTDGLLRDAEVLDEEAFFVVDRTINSEQKVFIERFSFDHRMDASHRESYTTTVIDGLDHLEGQEVDVRIDNSVLDRRTVSGGQVVLTAEEVVGLNSGNIVEVGINFPVNVQTMPMNTNIGSGENFLRLKRITRMNLRVYESTGLHLDGNPIPVRSFGEPFGSQEVYTGIISDLHPTEGWNRDTVPIISCPAPTQFHLQAIEYEVESS